MELKPLHFASNEVEASQKRLPKTYQMTKGFERCDDAMYKG